MPLVVGVDSSTSACKVVVRDADSGRTVSTGRSSHPATQPPRSEQHPETWVQAFAAACAEAGVPDRHRPGAVAVGGQQHGLVVVDDAGVPLRAAKLWNDTESAADADALVAALPGGATAWAQACGSVPLPSFTITKLRWLRRTEPDTFRQITGVLLPHDWITSQLTGARTTDRGDASGTGYWSPAEERYRPDLLALVDDTVDWEPLLPTVLPPTEPAGVWAATGAVVGPGTGDNMAAALGLGLQPGDVALSFGTSATAFAVSDQPSADAAGAVAGFADATGHFLPLVCTLNATKVTDAIARLLGVDAAGFDRLALEGQPGAGGLVLVPHFDGERTPNRPRATGVLSGLRADVTAADLARAAVEAVVCNLLVGAGMLLRDRGADGRTFLIGGGARSEAYRRVVADLTGRPVIVPDDDELVATGAAVQAAAVLQATDIATVTGEWNVGTGKVVEPDTSVDAEAILDAYARAADQERL